MLLVELTIGSLRTTNFEEKRNNKDLRANLDLIEERREQLNIRQAAYKHVVKRYYNQTVKEKAFWVGDYVLRRNEASRAQSQGKLGAIWEGPYKVVEANRSGKYTMKGWQIQWSWNARNLRKYHFSRIPRTTRPNNIKCWRLRALKHALLFSLFSKFVNVTWGQVASPTLIENTQCIWASSSIIILSMSKLK